MAGRSDEQIEQIATQLRKQLGIEMVKCPDMVWVITEGLKKIFPSFKLTLVLESDLPNADGQTIGENQEIKLRESVLTQAKCAQRRALFTIAEEVGHYVLNHGGVRNRTISRAAHEYREPQESRDEDEAKRFAAAFLAPAYLWSPEQDATILQNEFPIGTKTAEIRYEALMRMDRKKNNLLRPLPSFVIDFQEELRKRNKKPY